jgi:hypothetical protein
MNKRPDFASIIEDLDNLIETAESSGLTNSSSFFTFLNNDKCVSIGVGGQKLTLDEMSKSIVVGTTTLMLVVAVAVSMYFALISNGSNNSAITILIASVALLYLLFLRHISQLRQSTCLSKRSSFLRQQSPFSSSLYFASLVPEHPSTTEGSASSSATPVAFSGMFFFKPFTSFAALRSSHYRTRTVQKSTKGIESLTSASFNPITITEPTDDQSSDDIGSLTSENVNKNMDSLKHQRNKKLIQRM